MIVVMKSGEVSIMGFLILRLFIRKLCVKLSVFFVFFYLDWSIGNVKDFIWEN